MKKKPDVTILIPSINEGKVLTRVVNDCLKIKKYRIRIMIVLSNYSSNETMTEAKKVKARVVNIGDKLGKGTAINYALPYLKSKYTVQIDADYQFLPKEIPSMVDPLLKGVDVTLGTRYQKGSHIEPDSVSLLRLSGSYLLSLATSIFSGKRVTDVMAGFKGFKTDVLKDLNPQTPHFGYEAELAVRAARRGYKILNVPISYKKRNVGRSSVSSFKHGFLVLGTIINTAFE